MTVFCLKRLDDQFNFHWIFLWTLDMIFQAINYHLVKKISKYILSLKFEYFPINLYRTLLLKEIIFVKMAMTIHRALLIHKYMRVNLKIQQNLNSYCCSVCTGQICHSLFIKALFKIENFKFINKCINDQNLWNAQNLSIFINIFYVW